MPTITCQSCHKTLDVESKLSFREECLHCGHDLHSCLYCDFYDPSSYNECRESSADRVLEKEKANYCEYFVVKSNVDASGSNPGDDAKKKLEELFK